MCVDNAKEGILFILWDAFVSYERQNEGTTSFDVPWWDVCICKGAICLSFTLEQETGELLCTAWEMGEGHDMWSSPPYTGFIPQLWVLSLWVLSSNPLAGPPMSLGCCAWRRCGGGLLSKQGSALTCYALSLRSYHHFAGGEKKCLGVERQPQLSQEEEQPSGGSPPSLPQLPWSPASEHRVPAKQPRTTPLIKALLEYTLFNNSFSPRFLLSSWSCNSRKGFTVLTVVSTMRPRGLLDSSPDQGK